MKDHQYVLRDYLHYTLNDPVLLLNSKRPHYADVSKRKYGDCWKAARGPNNLKYLFNK